MPSLFTVSGYKIFFWSNENGEPIHVHISKGKPSANATKIWLTKTGGCIVANNGSDIPSMSQDKAMPLPFPRFLIQKMGRIFQKHEHAQPYKE